MKKMLLISAGCLLAVAGVAVAQGHRGGRGMRDQHMLQELDTNKDGRVTRDEMLAGAHTKFQAADANHDGRVTQEELHALFGHMKSEHFARSDKNGDGKLSADEVPRMPAGVFARLDANHDGALSADELAKGPLAHGNGDFFQRLDLNGDGAITQDEANAAATERFERMDKNGDKVLDTTELTHGGKWGHGHRGPDACEKH